MRGGRAIRLSRPRRVVIDLLHFARAVPSLPVQRRMNLAAVAAARQACHERPQWSAIFVKAYAIVAQEFPALRRAYVKFPWPQLYEYPSVTASIMFERDYEGEPGLFSMLVRNAASKSLGDLRDIVRTGASAPVETIKDFRRGLRIAGWPRPLRRIFWWLGLNVGRQRGNYFGTFGLSVYSALNVESLHPLSPLTSVVNYGYIGVDGEVNVRIIYDHRVMDGATVARALNRLEEILNGPIVGELSRLSAAPNAAKQGH
jgi:pyruvate/2-oxoglutarate dehydrogenase complex dihydrolipoamide acyltransferase (E2) component